MNNPCLRSLRRIVFTQFLRVNIFIIKEYPEKLVAQLKFQSLAENEIISVYVELLLVDKQNQITKKSASHTFDNILVRHGDIFGAQDPIIIADDNVVSFKLSRIKILFSNSMFWDNKDGHSMICFPVKASLK